MNLKKLNARGFSHDILAIFFVFIFAIVGIGYLVASHASNVALTKVWNTNAGWNTGVLSGVSVANNSVTLSHSSSSSGRHHKQNISTSYVTPGTITLSFNASSVATWNTLTPVSTLPTGTAITYQARTSSNGTSWSAWNSSVSSLSPSQYIQIVATLSTTNTTVTPTLSSLTLGYTVPVSAPSATLSASPTSIASGSSSTITWSSTNATSCSATSPANWTTSTTTSGSQSVSPASTTTYTMSCTGSGGSAIGTVNLPVGTPVTSNGGCTNAGVAAPCIGSATTGATGWGTPVFDDEFSGTSYSRTTWTPGWFNSGISGPVNSEEVACYDPANLSMPGDGYLHMNLIAKSTTCSGQGGGTRPYDGALISSNPRDGQSGHTGYQYTYGALEFRIYLPASGSKVANWPGTWTDGQSWPTDGENDVMEGLGGDACYHFHSPSGGPGSCATGNYSGWHTFGSVWKPGVVTYYYDGVQVGQISQGITTSPNYLLVQASTGINSLKIAPAEQLLDYVRVWQ
ncbi:MAG TPA: glycoside hydrolase family 16 protein [Candidatus Saccharimonadales bacterium]|nr:glycoside hydrolase family 16 protein [Candidatus Saccharimonadales bacterium]